MVGMGEFRYCKEDAMAWTIHEDIDFRRTLQIKMVSHEIRTPMHRASRDVRQVRRPRWPWPRVRQQWIA